MFNDGPPLALESAGLRLLGLGRFQLDQCQSGQDLRIGAAERRIFLSAIRGGHGHHPAQ